MYASAILGHLRAQALIRIECASPLQNQAQPVLPQSLIEREQAACGAVLSRRRKSCRSQSKVAAFIGEPLI